MSGMSPWDAGTNVELVHSDIREIDALAFVVHMLFIEKATDKGLPEPYAGHAATLLDMLRGASEQARARSEELESAGIRQWKGRPQ